MTVEAASFINSLDATLPSSAGLGDPVSEGDDHLRLLKSAIKATFPNVAGAMTLSHAQLNSLPSDIAVGDASVTAAVTAAYNAAITAAIAAAKLALFPVGSMYLSAVSTNPATLLGFGTWVAVAGGRLLAGVGTGTDSNLVVRAIAGGETAGVYEHTLTVSEMPSHGHPTRMSETTASTAQTQTNGGLMMNNTNNVDKAAHNGAVSATSGQQVGGTGGGASHNNMPPYEAVYIWRRSA